MGIPEGAFTPGGGGTLVVEQLVKDLEKAKKQTRKLQRQEVLTSVEGINEGITQVWIDQTTGKLYAGGGAVIMDVTGITAVAGDIGGWILSTYTLTTDSGAVGLNSEATAGTDWRFWAGNSTPANAPFRVDENGNLVATSATITGSITATTGVIGGWTVGATTLSSGTTNIVLDAGNKSIYIATATFGNAGIQLQYNVGTPRLYVGDASSAFLKYDGTKLTWKAANTELDASGNLTASSATLSGSITATSGAIGGWVIGTYTLTADSGIVGLNSQATAGVDWRFWAGHATPSSAPFRVDENGNLVASSATITGSITSTSGTIGGWSIGTSTLTGGNATLSSTGYLLLGTADDIVRIDAADATYRLWVGNAAAASAPFSVTKAGVLSSTSGTIGGWSITSTVLQKLSANVGIILNSATPSIQVGDTANIHLVLDGANKRLRSSNYVAGASGFNISADSGDAEFNRITARGLIKTAVFEIGTISAVGGSSLIIDSDVLATDMTVLDSSTLTIEGNTTFAVNDILRMKDKTNDEWLRVTSIASAPTYSVTRDLAGSYPANSNPAWKRGQAVVNYGVSGEGGVLLQGGAGPYVSVFTHTGSPWTTLTTHVKLEEALSRFGSNITAAGTTAFSIFHKAQTYNTESMGAGDVLLGDNTTGKANALWRASTGRLLFRGGTTAAAYIDTTGTLTAGDGAVQINASGVAIQCGTQPSNALKWIADIGGTPSLVNHIWATWSEGGAGPGNDIAVITMCSGYNQDSSQFYGEVSQVQLEAKTPGSGGASWDGARLVLERSKLGVGLEDYRLFSLHKTVGGTTTPDIFRIDSSTPQYAMIIGAQITTSVTVQLGQHLEITGTSVTNPPADYAKLTTTDVAAGMRDFLAITEGGIKGRILSTECTAYHNAAQTIANGTWTIVALNSKISDDEGWHNTVTNNARITVKETGIYLALVQNLEWAGNATGVRGLAISDGSGNVWNQYLLPAGTATTWRGGLSACRALTAGANGYIYCRVYQNSGGNLNLSAYIKLTLIKIK